MNPIRNITRIIYSTILFFILSGVFAGEKKELIECNGKCIIQNKEFKYNDQELDELISYMKLKYIPISKEDKENIMKGKQLLDCKAIIPLSSLEGESVKVELKPQKNLETTKDVKLMDGFLKDSSGKWEIKVYSQNIVFKEDKEIEVTGTIFTSPNPGVAPNSPKGNLSVLSNILGSCICINSKAEPDIIKLIPNGAQLKDGESLCGSVSFFYIKELKDETKNEASFSAVIDIPMNGKKYCAEKVPLYYLNVNELRTKPVTGALYGYADGDITGIKIEGAHVTGKVKVILEKNDK